MKTSKNNFAEMVHNFEKMLLETGRVNKYLFLVFGIKALEYFTDRYHRTHQYELSEIIEKLKIIMREISANEPKPVNTIKCKHKNTFFEADSSDADVDYGHILCADCNKDLGETTMFHGESE